MDLTFQHYGERRDLVCTEEERQLYNNVVKVLQDNSLDTKPLHFVRLSDNYLTAKYGDWDLVRIKYTARAKWLVFPVADLRAEKRRITSTDDLFDYVDMILESVAHIKKYS
jgi:hypothetical protein